MPVTSGPPAAITTLTGRYQPKLNLPLPRFRGGRFFFLPHSAGFTACKNSALLPYLLHAPLSTRPPNSTLLFSSAIIFLALCISFQGISQTLQSEQFFLYSGKPFPQAGHCVQLNPPHKTTSWCASQKSTRSNCCPGSQKLHLRDLQNQSPKWFNPQFSASLAWESTVT